MQAQSDKYKGFFLTSSRGKCLQSNLLLLKDLFPFSLLQNGKSICAFTIMEILSDYDHRIIFFPN